MLVCARLRHIATKEWGTKRYLNMKRDGKGERAETGLENIGKKGNVA